MTPARRSEGAEEAAFLAMVGELRPELHRYCARLTGSVIDGEDVVQDALAKAFVALDRLEASAPMRAWLFRIAHNAAVDWLRGRAPRPTEPLDAALETADAQTPDPLETLMRQEAVSAAVSRFVELPLPQRSVVILKDVLGHSLEDIATLLDITVNAVKGHLARGRSRLKRINAEPSPPPVVGAPSAEVARYVALFNARDWPSLRALLADDVKLRQSHYPLQADLAEVTQFFTRYATRDPVRAAAAWLEGREVIAVYEGGAETKPSYIMWLEWRDGKVVFIRDYRYVRYVMEDVEAHAPRAI